MHRFWYSSSFLLVALYALVDGVPLKEDVKIPEDVVEFVIFEVDKAVLPNFNNKADPKLRHPRQDDGDDGDGGGGEGAAGAAGSAAQTIGGNVIKVVTSALTGNAIGVLGGSIDLFGTGDTRKSVEGFFGNLLSGIYAAIAGPSTEKPAAGGGTATATKTNTTATAKKSVGQNGPHTEIIVTIHQKK